MSIKVQVKIEGQSVMVDRSLLVKDETGREYDYYLPDLVDGMYQPDLELEEAQTIESLEVAKRLERDNALSIADVEINKLIDADEDHADWSAYRVLLRNFPESSETWYEEDLPVSPI